MASDPLPGDPQPERWDAAFDALLAAFDAEWPTATRWERAEAIDAYEGVLAKAEHIGFIPVAADRLAALEEVAKAAKRREDTMAVIAAGSYPAATVDEGIAMMRAAYDDHYKARADLHDALAALAGLPEGEQ